MRSAFLIICLLALALIILSPALPARAAQDQPPITFEAYWALVEKTQQALLTMATLPEGEIRRGLENLAAEWEKVTAVQFPNEGVIQQIDTTPLVADLRATPPNLERLLSRIEALLAAHEQYPQNLFTVQDVVPLKQILTRPEFQWEEAQVIEMPDWLANFLDWLDRLSRRIANAIFRYGRLPLTIAAILLFLLALYFVSRNLSRSLVREAELTAQGGKGMLTSTEALQHAHTLSNAGDYRNAIRYLYLSALLTLDERGLLRYDRSRTNREVLHSVASKPQLERPLRSVIEVFDRAWYGFEPVDKETFQAYVAHVEELRRSKE
ncbi:MAG TPA: DUF4129 domain-containing protein [Anaerolineales bacterium]|nr:DUF4129 domain-containing protein [Anaerolineales bacterium]